MPAVSAMRGAPADAADEREILLATLLEAGLTGTITIAGDEMRPLFARGDRVVVGPFLGLPRPGQIVLARHLGAIIPRRLVEVRLVEGRRRYMLRADADPRSTLSVLRDDLVGRPTAILRSGSPGAAADEGPPRRR
jgi:hypothetical protein